MTFRSQATSLLLALAIAMCAYCAPEVHDNIGLIPGELLEPALIEPGMPNQEKGAGSGLHIVVVKGQDAVNSVKEKTAVQPIVEVLDGNDQPVAGAEVLFTSPHNGPSVTFLNGSRSMTIVTDANGRAAPVGLQPVKAGKFQIGVSASFRSQRATATIPMTNVMSTGATAASGKSKMSPAMIGVLVGVGAAAAAGIGLGLGGHHSSSSSTATTPTATIGVVSGGTAGAPH